MTKEKKQVFLPQVPPTSGILPFRIRGKQTIDTERMLQVKRVLNPEHSSLGSADIPKRKRFRAAKHETFRKTRRIQEVIQLQNSKQNRVCVPAQQGLGGLPVFPSSDLDVPWWTCALCGSRFSDTGQLAIVTLLIPSVGNTSRMFTGPPRPPCPKVTALKILTESKKLMKGWPDFAKAFDSCDTSLVISIFSKIGVLDKIVR